MIARESACRFLDAYAYFHYRLRSRVFRVESATWRSFLVRVKCVGEPRFWVL